MPDDSAQGDRRGTGLDGPARAVLVDRLCPPIPAGVPAATGPVRQRPVRS